MLFNMYFRVGVRQQKVLSFKNTAMLGCISR